MNGPSFLIHLAQIYLQGANNVGACMFIHVFGRAPQFNLKRWDYMGFFPQV